MTIQDLSTKEYDNYSVYYLELAKGEELLPGLQNTMIDTVDFFQAIPETKHNFRYAEGKWNVKEVLQHLIDVERIFDYRALWFARKGSQDLPGFDPDIFAASTTKNNRPMNDLIIEYKHLRKSTISMFKSFDMADLERGGIASGSYNSVRVLGFRLIGHDRHHINVIKDRYL